MKRTDVRCSYYACAKICLLVAMLVGAWGDKNAHAQFDRYQYGGIELRVYHAGERLPNANVTYAPTTGTPPVPVTGWDRCVALTEPNLSEVLRAVEYWGQFFPAASNGATTYTIDLGFLGNISGARGYSGPNPGGTSAVLALNSSSPNTALTHPVMSPGMAISKTVVHELCHSFRLGANTRTNGDGDVIGFSNYTPANLFSRFTSLLVDSHGTAAAPNQQFINQNNANFFDAFGADGVFFTGPNAMLVNHGRPVPVETQNTGSGTFLSHLAMGNGVIDFTSWSGDRTFLSEIELAVLMDCGQVTSINLRDHFGYSEYRDGRNLNLNQENNVANGTSIVNNVLFDSTAMLGVGLHVVGEYTRAGNASNPVNVPGNVIRLDADIFARGYGGTGIRIENNNNTVTIANGRTVQANGESGVGVLATRGTGTTLINRGTIQATGLNGRGVWFNAGAEKFDNTGIINVGAANDAIYIGEDGSVDEINLMRSGNASNIFIGNITNDGNDSTLTFGQSFNAATGEADGGSQTAYNFTYGGKISDNKFDIHTYGGRTTLTGPEYKFNSGLLGMGNRNSTLNILNSAEFNSLAIYDNGDTPDGSILTGADASGANAGRVSVSSGAVSNWGTVRNLTRFTAPHINNFNSIQANNEVRTTGSIWNSGVITNNDTITAGGNIDNVLGATISNTNALLKGWDLNNAGTIQTTAKMEMNNINNSGKIDGTSKMDVQDVVTNDATREITNTGTMTVGGRIDNNGLIDGTTLIDVTGTSGWVAGAGDINNNGTIQNVVTLQSAANLTNSGVVEKFTTANVGGNLANNLGGFIDVAATSAMNVAVNGTNAGELKVNGNAAFGGTFTNLDGVPNQGRVNGTGKVSTVGGFFNNGVIAPGNSIGTLTIAGPFTNGATGRFEIEVDPSHYPSKPFAGLHNDLVNIVSNPAGANNGTATINGGYVDVDAPSNDKSVNAAPARYVGNTKYIFLDTENVNDLQVNTELEAVNPPNLLLFDFLADYDRLAPKSYWLDVQRQYYYGPFGDTFNQIAVGNYLDDIGLDPDPLGDFFGVLVALDGLNAGIPHRTGISRAAKFAEDQMSGAIYGSLAQQSVMNTTIVNNTLNDVLRRDAFGYKKASACDPCDPCGSGKPLRRNAWGLGYGIGGTTKHDGNAYGYDQSFAGTIVGVDRLFKKNTRTGMYFSYGEGRISSDLFDRSKSKELLVGLYLRKNLYIGYAILSGGLGYNQYDTERTISFVNRKARNDHSAFVGTLYGERGLEFKTQNGKVQPFLGLQYVGNQQESFTERGANSLNLLGDIVTGNSFRSLLGSRFSTDVNRSVSLFGQVVWMHEFLDRTSTDFTAQFSNPGMANFSSTSKYTVRGNNPGRDWVILGTGLNRDAKNWRVFAGYDAYINSRQVLHTGNAGIAFGW